MSDPAEQSAKSEQVWESGWEGHRRRQQARMAELTLAQKLAWLEEAHRLVRQLDHARRVSGKAASEPE